MASSPPPPSRFPPPTGLLEVDLTQDETPQQPQPPLPPSASAHALEAGGEGGCRTPPPPAHQPSAVLTLPGLLLRAKWASEKCLEGMDYMGEAVAAFLGVTDSRYQYIVDNMSEKDKEAAEKDLGRMREEREEGRRRGGGGGGMLLVEELAAGRGEEGREGGVGAGGGAKEEV